MLIRIDNEAGRTHGWQARWPLEGKRYLSEFFADKKHGGQFGSHRAAVLAERRLANKARRLRRQSRP